MFCTKCGREQGAKDNFCSACGAKVIRDGATRPGDGEGTDSDKTTGRGFSYNWQDIKNTADLSASFSKDDMAGNKLMAILSYLWVLVFIPILAGADSPYARFHANQGLLICIGWVGKWFLMSALYPVFPGVFGALLDLLDLGLTVILLVINVMGLLNAVRDEAKELPIVGHIRLIR